MKDIRNEMKSVTKSIHDLFYSWSMGTDHYVWKRRNDRYTQSELRPIFEEDAVEIRMMFGYDRFGRRYSNWDQF